MVEKINAFVCDGCRKCSAKSVDGYTVDNEWVFDYRPEGTRHYCPDCAKPAAQSGDLKPAAKEGE